MNQPLYYQKFKSVTQFWDDTLAVGNDGYLSLHCTSCFSFVLFKCSQYQQTYVQRNHNRRNIKHHMIKKHGWSTACGDGDISGTLPCPDDDDCPPSKERTGEEYDDHDDDFDDGENEAIVVLLERVL